MLYVNTMIIFLRRVFNINIFHPIGQSKVFFENVNIYMIESGGGKI
jgi:hypothetical protein